MLSPKINILTIVTREAGRRREEGGGSRANNEDDDEDEEEKEAIDVRPDPRGLGSPCLFSRVLSPSGS